MLDGGDESYGGPRAYFRFLLCIVDADIVGINGALGHKRASSCMHYASALDKSCTSLAFAIALKQEWKVVEAFLCLLVANGS